MYTATLYNSLQACLTIFEPPSAPPTGRIQGLHDIWWIRSSSPSSDGAVNYLTLFEAYSMTFELSQTIFLGPFDLTTLY